jgi:3-phosphoshikimate 1-carboxyvinyltransferase
VPGDKSISHRALMLAATASGRTTVRNLAPGGDVQSSAECLRAYGVTIEQTADVATIHSRGIDEWTAPAGVLDCRNSGTTMRVLAGLAARCDFTSTFDGDASLRRRPMERVALPLRTLGADVETSDAGRAPMSVRGGHLVGASIETGVASAQVKSSVMLAALGADGTTTITEPLPTRDHTERILAALGADVSESREAGTHRVVVGPAVAPPFDLAVPGDVSSAAFVVAAAVLGGEVRIEGVGLNPLRIGFLDALREMGASVVLEVLEERMNEPVGIIDAERAALVGISVDPRVIPTLTDELPLLAVVATQAQGETVVRGASELRVKEADRIAAIVEGLRLLGAEIEELEDGFVVNGPTVLEGTSVDPKGDHRLAMALAVAGLIAKGEMRVHGFECAAVSWPGFEDVLGSLGAEVMVEP